MLFDSSGAGFNRIAEKRRYGKENLMGTLEKEILQMYYGRHDQWLTILKTAGTGIVPEFESGRLADEYYTSRHAIKG